LKLWLAGSLSAVRSVRYWFGHSFIPSAEQRRSNIVTIDGAEHRARLRRLIEKSAKPALKICKWGSKLDHMVACHDLADFPLLLPVRSGLNSEQQGLAAVFRQLRRADFHEISVC
jgi:hypothetical protein